MTRAAKRARRLRGIQPTPVLYGQDARRFLAGLENACSPEEMERRVAAAKKRLVAGVYAGVPSPPKPTGPACDGAESGCGLYETAGSPACRGSCQWKNQWQKR